ncbi:hypothetical protein C1645_786716 [Glomus cerebriforme]|uniref:Uncharacterized protein n=1 Tax=Glomus cerebriforme TaxID=658196 RepID=A0A397SEK6_9GLOM|nr:hypothetical protein C1645_786716 [Glomus cerebriforme]
MNSILDRMINYNNICSLPSNTYVQKLANQARNGEGVLILTGEDLMKRNIEHEARQLQLHYNQHDIDSLTNEYWNSRLTLSQKNRFINLAKYINQIRNNKTIDLIVQINRPQITNTPFEYALFNGTSFYDDKITESSILPAGCSNSSLFP